MHRKQIFAASVTIIMLIVLAFSLSGCFIYSPSQKMYYNDIDKDEIEKIEIYNCREEIDSYQGVYEHTIDEKDPIYTLENSEIESFVRDLSKIRFYSPAGLLIGAVDPSFHFGELTAKIHFIDGSVLYLSDDNYCLWLNADESVKSAPHLAPDKDEWKSFINKYIPNA